MTNKKTAKPAELNDDALDNVAGGVLIALLLPAVQKAQPTVAGSSDLQTEPVARSGPHVKVFDGSSLAQ